MANEQDNLSVELGVTGDTKAFKTLDDFRNKAESVNKSLDDLGKDSQLAKNFSLQSQKAQSEVKAIAKSLEDAAKVEYQGNGLKWVRDGSIQAKKEILSLREQIKELGKTAPTTNPLSILTSDAQKLQSELAKAERNLAYLQNKPIGADGKPINSPKSGGLSQSIKGAVGGLISEQVGSLGLPPSVSALIDGQVAAALEAVSLTAVAGLAAVAAVSYGIVKISQSIREEAEKRLKVEESIQGAINNQILSQQKGLADLKEARENAANNRQFNQSLAGQDIDGLKRQRATLEQLSQFIPATLPVLEKGKVVEKANEDFERNNQKIAALDARLAAIPQELNGKAASDFAQRFDSFSRQQDQQAENERKKAEQFAQSVKAGKEKVKELQKTTADFFNSLSARANSDNPFVSVFEQANKAIQSVRENTKLLSKDLQSSLLALQESANAKDLFSTRLDTGLQALDLRERAGELRNFQPKVDNKLDENYFQSVVQKRISKFDDGAIRNDFALNLFDEASKRKDKRFSLQEEFSIYADAELGKFDIGSLNFNSRLTGLARERIQRENAQKGVNGSQVDENLSLQERFDKQLAIIEKSKFGLSENDTQSLADKRILALSGQFKPEQLTGRERDIIALSAEREANRLAKSEADAKELDKKRQTTLEGIHTELAAYNRIAEKEGLKGVNIRILDESNGKVDTRVQKTATPKDTAKAMFDQ